MLAFSCLGICARQLVGAFGQTAESLLLRDVGVEKAGLPDTEQVPPQGHQKVPIL